jgi:hypothetical protein
MPRPHRFIEDRRLLTALRLRVGSMKTVRDLFAEIAELKAAGHSPHSIGDEIARRARAAGHAPARQHVGASGTLSIQFSTGETIGFNGAEWYLAAT